MVLLAVLSIAKGKTERWGAIDVLWPQQNKFLEVMIDWGTKIWLISFETFVSIVIKYDYVHVGIHIETHTLTHTYQKHTESHRDCYVACKGYFHSHRRLCAKNSKLNLNLQALFWNKDYSRTTRNC